jgi:uncharacterized protein YhfF
MIGEKTTEVEEYWIKACEQYGITADDYHCSTFGDPKFADYGDHVTELAMNETKRATAHLAMDFDINGVKRRQEGDYWVVLWENMKPAGVLKMVKVEERPFKDVDAAFAAREGEGDGSLEYWSRIHEDYFKLQLNTWGKEWSEDLPVVLESFDLVK